MGETLLLFPVIFSPPFLGSRSLFACSLTHEKSQDCLPACGSKAASEALSSSHCCSSLGFGVAEPPGSMRRCRAFLWSVIMERWAVTQLWEACPTGPGPPPQTSAPAEAPREDAVSAARAGTAGRRWREPQLDRARPLLLPLLVCCGTDSGPGSPGGAVLCGSAARAAAAPRG